jgi:SpoVK/Ycf46/Vps4 family AAA+-type ATPase
MFLIDDFGRQLIRPTDLLNRWIVPLEKRTDFLTLITGKKITIPFEELIVFSTNLDPTDLVDDAFLRRIKFKINVQDPDVEQFRQIFQLVARSRQIEFDENTFNYLLERHYRPSGRPLRMCQPRDLLDQLVAIARYKMLKPAMTPELVDAAASTYFVTMGPAAAR